MRTVTVNLACRICGDDVPDRLFATSTPGLVVGPALPCGHGETGWFVVHERSGLFIQKYDDPETAMLVAARLGELGIDWTLPGNDLTQHAAQAAQITGRYRGDIYDPQRVEALDR